MKKPYLTEIRLEPRKANLDSEANLEKFPISKVSKDFGALA